MTDFATQQQPMPMGMGTEVLKLVQEDLNARAEVGLARYGEKLTTHNGRNALMDAYQEALDLVMYLRQVLYEKEGK